MVSVVWVVVMISMLHRMVTKGYSAKVALVQDLMEVEKQAKSLCGQRIFQTEATARHGP